MPITDSDVILRLMKPMPEGRIKRLFVILLRRGNEYRHEVITEGVTPGWEYWFEQYDRQRRGERPLLVTL